MRNTRLQDFSIADWLPAGVGLDDAIVLLASLAVLAAFLAMWQALRPKTSFERRLEQVVQRKESLREAALATRSSQDMRTPEAVGRQRSSRTRRPLWSLLRVGPAAESGRSQCPLPGPAPMTANGANRSFRAGTPCTP